MEHHHHQVPIPSDIVRMCVDQFDKVLEPYNCIQVMATIQELEERGVAKCSMPSALPEYRHIMNFTSGCDWAELTYLQYAVPPLMILCFFGNMLNVLIYGLPFFNGSSSVHFLRAKAIANMVFMFSRILEVLHASSTQPLSWLEPLFWKSRPYLVMVSNISGTMSTWLTLMVTLETVMCIMTPFIFKKYCTKKTTWTVLIMSAFAATLLHVAIVIVTEVQEHAQVRQYIQNFKKENAACWFLQSVFRVRNDPYYETYRRFYATATMAVSIVIPTIAMLVFTILIIKKFTFKNLGDSFTQRRKCVLRLTASTTFTHLILEGPATLTHSASAIQGDNYSYLMCILNHGNNLASLVNATIPFFVFLICNEQFRHMALMYIKAMVECDPVKRQSYFVLAGQRCSRMSRVETDRSFVETTRVATRPTHALLSESVVKKVGVPTLARMLVCSFQPSEFGSQKLSLSPLTREVHAR
ncbi:Protein CBG18923 [Caenorhabditis briggsae]|uniref:G-protein coupled receptors family 1 profile domain-containing protein n=2 Tax=Caenorhabditis briggsae TaxID=6238 RepID=A0AAE9A7N3_CAEBR|nr:Protein CBG18923 [Caenorhabditis briggsae]ULT90236.1 hypothetical protein L3Y34_008532 [Caenorhabditis briggsae]CAP36254.2 Protein CBG18923 [Caenorhabditis briggsae]